MTELAAVVGMGQTKHSSKNGDVSIAGLVRESAEKALIDANLDWNDIDAVILGKAPDMFEGVMMPELYLSDALVANNKPILRVHTAGSVGGSTGIVAASYVQSGLFKRVLVSTSRNNLNLMLCGLFQQQFLTLPLSMQVQGVISPLI